MQSFRKPTVCAQTSAGKAPPARSATVTDRAAVQPSRRAVVAGKQRRGRAAHPPHPCRRCGLPLHFFDPVSILPEFLYLISSEAENLALENQNKFFQDYPGEECWGEVRAPPLVPGTKLHLVTEQNLLGWTMKFHPCAEGGGGFFWAVLFKFDEKATADQHGKG